MVRRLLAVCALLCVAAPARADSGDDKKLLEQADKVGRKVAKLRGLKQKRPIKRGVMNKQQIKQRLLQRVDQEYTPKEIAAEELAMKRLGLLEPKADYLKLVIKLLTDQIAGFYDPWEQQLYIASWGGFGGDMLLAHEIDHALQDQHFDLRAFMKKESSNADALVARQALVEGDGTALMLEYSMDEMGQTAPWGQPKFLDTFGPAMTSAMGQLDDAPLALREGLLFPYLRGLNFVAHFLKHHSWKRIDEIYRKPPLSTEQVLHPAKYESYEEPVAIASAALVTLKGYAAAYDNVTGELGISVMLRQHGIGDDKAAEAAMGWGGDRFVVYTPPSHKGKLAGTVGVLYTVWDDTADAVEFFEALTHAMPSLTAGKAINKATQRVDYEMKSGAIAIAERQRDAVLLVIGAPPARSDDVRSQAWSSWKRK